MDSSTIHVSCDNLDSMIGRSICLSFVFQFLQARSQRLINQATRIIELQRGSVERRGWRNNVKYPPFLQS